MSELTTIKLALRASLEADLNYSEIQWVNDSIYQEFQHNYPNVEHVINNILEMKDDECG